MNHRAPHIYLIRHGHIDTGPGRTFVGQTDLLLSTQGVGQARNLALTLAEEPLTRIVVSDLRRALTTATFIAAAHGLEVEVAPEFREISLGMWEGRSLKEIAARYPEELALRARDPENFRPPRGENFSDLHHRVVPAFEKLVKALESDLAIITHVGVIRVIVCHVLGIPINNLLLLEHDYGAYTKLLSGIPLKLLHFNVTPRSTVG